LIDHYNAAHVTKLEQELFEQRARLAGVERTLQTIVTKAATDSKRNATDKIDARMCRLDNIGRGDLKERDWRIFPGQIAYPRLSIRTPSLGLASLRAGEST